MKRFIIVLILIPLYSLAQNSIIDFNNSVDKTLIIKVKNEYRGQCENNRFTQADFIKSSQVLEITKISKLFPRIEKPEEKLNLFGEPLVDLTLVYQIEYQNDISLQQAVILLNKLNLFEYVDVKHFYKPLYITNDPNRASQYYLTKIRAYDAWDISKGDSTIVIAIIDTGNDFNHNDLKKKVAYNKADPIDGIDNDNDGYLDNYMGWDFGTNDNNPQITSGNHGVFVAGLAAAHTDNAIGISGVGFNTRYLPIKIADQNEFLVNGYEAIIYVAEHGANIINLSWGGTLSSGSSFEQDVVNYATFNRSCLIVAACGNDGNTNPFYPASYKNVLSVSMTDVNDTKVASSSYGYYVDIAAPGGNVYSTIQGNSYASSSGTSFASPITAACAAIVKSYFPALSPLQIAERLRVTSDIIDTTISNISFYHLFGTGRVNLYRALTDNEIPSIRLMDVNFVGKTPDQIIAGDTIIFNANFKNFLAPTQNLIIKLKSLSPYLTVLDSIHAYGSVGTMVSFSNPTTYRIIVSQNIPYDEILDLKFEFMDESYFGYDYQQFTVNQTYIKVDENRITTTFTGNSRIGFANNLFNQGEGFRFDDGSQLFYVGGLMIGTGTNNVSDNTYSQNGYDNDFTNTVLPYKVQNSLSADFEAYTEFNDNGAGLNKLNVLVKNRLLAWNTPQTEKFIIQEFTIINSGITPLISLYSGLFIDWDIDESTYNRSKYDSYQKMLYCWSPLGGKYGAISTLSDYPFNRYAFDMDGVNLSLKISDGFTTVEKYTAMSLNRDSAGFSGGGNDVANLLSYGPFSISPGDSIIVAFTVMAGDNPIDLKQSAQSAYDKYYNVSSVLQNERVETNLKIYPNPANDIVFIAFNPAISEKFSNIKVLDVMGKVQPIHYTSYSNQIEISLKNLNSGFYVIVVETPSGVYKSSFIKN